MHKIPESERNEYFYWNMLPLKAICTFYQFSNLYFQLQFTLGQELNNVLMYYVYWSIWILISVLMIYSYCSDKSQVYRIILQILVIRNMLSFLNFEERTITDLLSLYYMIITQVNVLYIFEFCVLAVEPFSLGLFHNLIVDLVINYRITAFVTGWPD